jgi:undecaprenyl-diphosphatase
MDMTPIAPKDRSAAMAGPAPSPGLLVGAGGVCWLGFAGLCWLVLNGRGGALDEAGLMFWRDGPMLLPRGPVWLLEAVRDVTALGGVLLRNVAVLAGFAVLWNARRRRAAWVLVGTVMTGWAVEGALKLLVGRDRPMIVPHLTEAGGASFPSGHSFNAALVYLALALAFAPAHRRWATCAAAMVLSAGIATSRVWLGVHFPTDALAGWLGGTAWAFTAAALLDRPARAIAAQA